MNRKKGFVIVGTTAALMMSPATPAYALSLEDCQENNGFAQGAFCMVGIGVTQARLCRDVGGTPQDTICLIPLDVTQAQCTAGQGTIGPRARCEGGQFNGARVSDVVIVVT